MNIIKIYTDGGFRRKSRVGAYGSVTLINKVMKKEIYQAVPQIRGLKVTNNTMELQAVIKSFNYLNWLVSNGLKPKDYSVYLWTDSQYVQLGLTEWINNWKDNGWRTASNTPVENKELWIELDTLYQNLKRLYHSVNVQWVEGHTGDEWNERADELCNKAMDEYIINK